MHSRQGTDFVHLAGHVNGVLQKTDSTPATLPSHLAEMEVSATLATPFTPDVVQGRATRPPMALRWKCGLEFGFSCVEKTSSHADLIQAMSTNLTESTASSLLRRVSGKESAAWERFARVYTPFVYRWCRQSGLQSHDIDDVVQEVFRSVAAGIGGYLRAPQGRFRGWLWGITKNKLGDHFRRVGKRVQPVGGDTGHNLVHQFEASTSSSTSDWDVDDDRLIVQRTLELLKPEFEATTWQAFWRTAVDNERAADIAAELGMTKKAVRQAKYRVLKRLRAELELQLDSDP